MRRAKGGVLVAGGGFAGAYVARLLGSRGATIVSPDNFMLFTPLLPEAASGMIEPRHVVVPLRQMCPHAELLLGDVTAIDREARTVHVETADAGAFDVGYEHLEVLIDDASRYTVVVPVADETAASAVRALEVAATEFAAQGIRIERVLTDNGSAYRSQLYRRAVEATGARHKHTRPWRPQTNGKAERVIQTLLREWAYARLYRSNDERARALPVFVDFYNRRRPHTALGGRSPLDAVNNVPGDHT